MNEKEIAEIRRRFRPDKNNISRIRGCYVNEQREIISEFDQSLALVPDEEAEKLLGLLRKTLSGTQGKNLADITFSTQQVVDSEEHQLLMALKTSALGQEDAVHTFFQKVIQSLTLEDSYLILLSYDTYDVPYRSADGQRQDDASSEVFSYVLCSICPLKMTKPALSYYVTDRQFHSCKTDWVISSPELGFLFPAFDDRSTNLYNALYYTRDPAAAYQPFVDSIFHTELPMPAQEQKEAFQTILEQTLSDACSYDVVQTVHEQLCDMIEEHKASKSEEPLTISKETVKHMLTACGVSEPQVTAFGEQFDTEFGTDANLSPRNLVDVKRFEVSTPNVTVHVAPGYSDLVQTRIIDGTRYILIRANEDVAVNGVSIQISE